MFHPLHDLARHFLKHFKHIFRKSVKHILIGAKDFSGVNSKNRIGHLYDPWLVLAFIFVFWQRAAGPPFKRPHTNAPFRPETSGRPERAPCCTTTRHAGGSTTTPSAPGCCTTDWPALCLLGMGQAVVQQSKVRANP